MTQSNDDLMTLEAAAAHLGLLAMTIRDAVRRGHLLPERCADGVFWFRRETIDRYARTLGIPEPSRHEDR